MSSALEMAIAETVAMETALAATWEMAPEALEMVLEMELEMMVVETEWEMELPEALW